MGELNGWIEETVSGQRVIKAYGRQAAALATFDTANQSYRRAATRAQIFSGFMGPLMNFVNNVSLALVVAAGGWLAVLGLATVGEIATFINYSRQFGRPLNELATLYNTIQAAIAGAERVFALMDEPSEFEEDPYGPQASSPAPPVRSQTPHVAGTFKGDVVLDDVSFSYVPDTPVLKHVSLHALPGPDRRPGRPDRRRQDHHRQPADALLRSRQRLHHASTASTSGRSPSRTCAASSASCCRTPISSPAP